MLETPTAASWNYAKFMRKVRTYYAIVCSEIILGHGPCEMAFLSSSAITKRDVTNGLVFVLYHETMFIGNLFI